MAVIGAMALAVHGIVRSTADLDLLAAQEHVLWERTWTAARRRRLSIDVRLGDDDDPLCGVVRVGARARMPVDVIVVRGLWARRIVERAIGPEGVRSAFSGVELPVARLSDVLLLKLYAAATDVVEDAELILRHPEASRVLDEVEHEIAALPRDCQERWTRLGPVWRRGISG